MRYSVLALLANALLASALPAPQHEGHTNTTDNEVGPLPAGFKIAKDLVAGQPETPGARIVDQRFGPFRVTAGGERNFVQSAPMPCNNCYVLAAQGTMEYADGSEANINTGAWLHHMVMVRSGGVMNGAAQCNWFGTGGGGLSGIMGGIGVAQMWSTGNERVTKRTNSVGKYGHKITSTSPGMMTFELMNESDQDKDYYLRFRYEVLDANSLYAIGYQAVATLWLDIGACTGTFIPAQQGVYQIESPVFKITRAGKLLETSSHLHDGGTKMTVFVNGREACTSRVLYGRKPGTREPVGSHHAGALHISDAELCQDFADVKVNDEVKVIAYYDAITYPQMVHDGRLHPIMGIMSTVVAPNPPL